MITYDSITGEVAEDLLHKIESSRIPCSTNLTKALAIISFGGSNKFKNSPLLIDELTEILLEIDCSGVEKFIARVMLSQPGCPHYNFPLNIRGDRPFSTMKIFKGWVRAMLKNIKTAGIESDAIAKEELSSWEERFPEDANGIGITMSLIVRDDQGGGLDYTFKLDGKYDAEADREEDHSVRSLSLSLSERNIMSVIMHLSRSTRGIRDLISYKRAHYYHKGEVGMLFFGRRNRSRDYEEMEQVVEGGKELRMAIDYGSNKGETTEEKQRIVAMINQNPDRSAYILEKMSWGETGNIEKFFEGRVGWRFSIGMNVSHKQSVEVVSSMMETEKNNPEIVSIIGLVNHYRAQRIGEDDQESRESVVNVRIHGTKNQGGYYSLILMVEGVEATKWYDFSLSAEDFLCFMEKVSCPHAPLKQCIRRVDKGGFR